MGSRGGGGSADPTKYYIKAEEQVICLAPIDLIRTIKVNNVIAYDDTKKTQGDSPIVIVGLNPDQISQIIQEMKANNQPINKNCNVYINKPDLFGGKDSEGGIKGLVDFRFGKSDQEKSETLRSKIGDVVLSATRGVVSMVMSSFYLGNNPYAKSWHFRIKSTNYQGDYQSNWYQQKATISHGGNGSSSDLSVLNFVQTSGNYYVTNNASRPELLIGFVSNSTYENVKNQQSLQYYYLNTDLSNSSGQSFKNDVRVRRITGSGAYGNVYSNIGASNYYLHVCRILNNNEYLDVNGKIQDRTTVLQNVPDNVENDSSSRTTSPCVSYDAFTGACIWFRGSVSDNTIDMRLPYSYQQTQQAGSYGGQQVVTIKTYETRTIFNNTSDVCVFACGNYCYLYDNNSSDKNIKCYSHSSNTTIDISNLIKDCRRVLAFYVNQEDDSIIVLTSFNTSNPYIYNLKLVYGNTQNQKFNEVDVTDKLGGENRQTILRNQAYFVYTTNNVYLIFQGKALVLNKTSGSESIGVQDDYNPVHAIREILTNKVWGLGKDESIIDDDNFKMVANTLYNENMGISFTYENTEKVSELLQKILNIINGVLRLNRQTGKLELKLIRDDYDKNSLPVFNYDNIIEISEISRTALSECINQVTLKYTDYETGNSASFVIQDLGLLSQTKEINNSDIDYPYIYWKETAEKVALRELCDLSSQFMSCEIKTNTDGRKVSLGDVIIVNFPRLNITNFVFRVQKINYGSSSDQSVRMTLTQDKFDYPKTEAYVPTKPSGSGGSIYNENNNLIKNDMVIETPYYFAYKKIGLDNLNSNISTNPNFSKLSILVSKYKASGVSDVKAYLSYDNGQNFTQNDGTIPFVYSCTLTENLDYLTKKLAYSNGYGMSKVSNEYLGIIGNEIIAIGSNEDITGSISIGRGCLDTVPCKHSIGDICYFVKRDELPILNEEFGSEQIISRVIGYASNEWQYSTSGSHTTFTNMRMLRPYPVANVTINNEYYKTDYDTVDYRVNPLTIKYCMRNRLSQITDDIYSWEADNITPEDNTTVELRWVVDNNVVHTQTLTSLEENVLVPSSIDDNKVTLRIVTIRDGLECYYPFEQEIKIMGSNSFIEARYNSNDGTVEINKEQSFNVNFNLVDGVLQYTIDDTLDQTLSFELSENGELVRKEDK